VSENTLNKEKNIIALSVPTGVGAEFGGFAGDAGHIAREFSKYFKVIVNPNVVNAGILSAINDEMFYVEGYAFDEFFNGKISLKPRFAQIKYAENQKGSYAQRFNKIGVIFDSAIPENILNIHINTINAAKIVKGYDIPYIEITKNPAGVSLVKDSTGISTGRINNEKTLFNAAKSLVDKGVEAIAAVCYFNDECEDEDYNNGAGVDPIGGIEAVVSHYLTKEFMLPAAHSPAFSGLDISYNKMNAKVASEFISSTYLPCILDGLSTAPALVKHSKKTEGIIINNDVKCLIVPDAALGSKAVISALKNGIEVCAVKNKTVLSIDCNKLKENGIMDGIELIKEFSSYQNCLNYVRDRYE